MLFAHLGAVLERFGDVIAGDCFRAGEVGDRARDFEYAIVPARGQLHRHHRVFEQYLRLLIYYAMRAREPGGKLGIGEDLMIAEPLLLDRARTLHSCANRVRCFRYRRFG